MVPLLRIVNLSKQFGTLNALHNLNLNVYRGEVIGLAGRSGAGKSVLAGLIAGTYTSSAGSIYFNNHRIQWPFKSRDMGLEVIHQEPSLAYNLDITTNIFLGNEIGWPGIGRLFKIPHRRRMNEIAQQILTDLGVQFPSLEEQVANLSSEQRQLVAIAQTMVKPAKMIFVDEPTVLLGYSYRQKLLHLIQRWQQEGVAVMFGSKNLEHLFAVTDRIVTLRKGRMVAEHRTDEVTREQVVAELLGTDNQDQFTPAIWALDSYYAARQQAQQLQHKQSLLERNLQQQDTLNQQLVEQLAEQVDALDQVNSALQAAQRRLLTERELERKHLAREIHDQVIQDLLSVNYQLEDLGEEDYNPDDFSTELTDVRISIRQMVSDLRRICGNLRPPTIDSLGLGAAVQSYASDWSERCKIDFSLDLDDNLGRLPETIELSIFRIIQEGLSNIRKHAQASHVSITLKHTTPRMLMIAIADNGVGIAEKVNLSTVSAKGHYGLLGISERVALMRGRLRMQNQPKGGLLLHVEIPHPRVTGMVNPIGLSDQV
ncbi:ATP-binding cassette domain-containing protein [Anaerolineales bacterium HSG6]|nr:ATP-binding cassette domain-containing protein [Anaerolineales bacterium HSG6]